VKSVEVASWPEDDDPVAWCRVGWSPVVGERRLTGFTMIDREDSEVGGGQRGDGGSGPGLL
jgi:hypothetical protein